MARKERGNPLLKMLDYGAGIPLLLLLSLFRNRKGGGVRISGARSIALFKSAAIGDTVVMSAVVADIRRANPAARLTVVTGSSNYEMARLIPGVDEVLRLPVTSPFKAMRRLRQEESYDVWIDFGSWPRLDALISWAARSALTVGFRTKGQYRHYLYDVTVEHLDDRHELDNYRNLVAPLGVDAAALPQLKAPDVAPQPDLAVVHMFPGGTRSYIKEWPQERWSELVSELCGRGFRVVLTGGAADRARAEELAGKLAGLPVQNAAGSYSLEQTVALLKSAAVVVSVNTGIMHIASALGCNVVSLNGPTSVLRWGTLNANSVSLTPRLACAPCINLGFEYKCDSNRCMCDIGSREVLEAVARLTGKGPS